MLPNAFVLNDGGVALERKMLNLGIKGSKL
jgi:hypothetical protein